MKHCTAHPRPRVHRKPRWLLQHSTVRCRWRCHPTIAVSPACCHAADHRHPTLRAHHTNTTWHSPLAADITAHHLPNCADDVPLFSRPMSEVLWWCVHSCTHRCCSFAIAISRTRWHRRPTRMVHSVWLPQFPRVRTNNLEQTSTGSAKHRC